MKLPRDLSGRDLASALSRLGYAVGHHTGSHIRLTTIVGGEHHITVPDRSALGDSLSCCHLGASASLRENSFGPP